MIEKTNFFKRYLKDMAYSAAFVLPLGVFIKVLSIEYGNGNLAENPIWYLLFFAQIFAYIFWVKWRINGIFRREAIRNLISFTIVTLSGAPAFLMIIFARLEISLYISLAVAGGVFIFLSVPIVVWLVQPKP
tara:strand:+ start:100 stop:495 length:396 start_codon:yes stop_codon:yes gene_type:complete